MVRSVRRAWWDGRSLRGLLILAAVGGMLLGAAGCTGSRPAPQVVPARTTGTPSTPSGVEDWVYPDALRSSRRGSEARTEAPQTGSGARTARGSRPGQPVRPIRAAGRAGKHSSGKAAPGRPPVLPWAWVPALPAPEDRSSGPSRSVAAPLPSRTTAAPAPPPQPVEIKPVPVEAVPVEPRSPAMESPPAGAKPPPSEQRPEPSRPGDERTPSLPESAPAAADTVYITASGKKYHRAGCSYLRKSGTALRREAARADGYSPCSRCIR